jgi:phosphatidylserine/phosphatidylglycerophosphate/cardiolipin synthase-like enzyme
LAAVLVASSFPSSAQQAVQTFYSPESNLERIDVDIIGRARSSIDVAAYVLSDWSVVDALNVAAGRGVRVRVVLDPTQKHALDRFSAALDVRVARPGPYMHLKSYAVDGVLLRTGSANLSASGLKQQDNDLVVADDRAAASRFESKFASIYAAAVPLQEAMGLLGDGRGNRNAGYNGRQPWVQY